MHDKFNPKPSVVDFAREIIELANENAYLRRELEFYKEYKEKYDDLLQQDIQHHEKIFGSILKAIIDPNSNLNTKLLNEKD